VEDLRDEARRVLCWRLSDVFLTTGILLSSSPEVSYKSSNSVTSVKVLDLFHGFEDVEGELLSSAEIVEGDEGSIGADRK
jgi:hypothetical protein